MNLIKMLFPQPHHLSIFPNFSGRDAGTLAPSSSVAISRHTHMYIVQYVRIHLVCLEVKMTPNKELLNAKSYPFHQDYKVQIALLLIEHR